MERAPGKGFAAEKAELEGAMFNGEAPYRRRNLAEKKSDLPATNEERSMVASTGACLGGILLRNQRVLRWRGSINKNEETSGGVEKNHQTSSTLLGEEYFCHTKRLTCLNPTHFLVSLG